MKKLILLLAVIMLMPTVAEAQKPRRGAKEVSPFIEGKQKVRKTDYDSIWKFIEQGEAFRTLMAYYKCAIMEIETKFNVLN